MRLVKYGAVEDRPPEFEIVHLTSDPLLGRWILVRAARQEIEIRITRSGQLRVSKAKKAGEVRAE